MMKMCVFKWTPLLLNLTLLLQITAEATGHSQAVVVEYRESSVLPCDDVKTDTCSDVSWFFRGLKKPDLLKLVQNGRIVKEKSKRMRLRGDCSLWILNVSDEDAGNYSCSEASSGKRRGNVTLSVVKGKKSNGELEKNCSLTTPEFRRFTVISKIKQYTKKKPLYWTQMLRVNSKRSLNCIVSEKLTGKTWKFGFSISESTNLITILPTLSSTLEKSTPVPNIEPQSADKTKTQVLYIVTAAVLAAVLVFISLIVLWKRRKANETQRSNSDANPEEGVSYTTVIFNKRHLSKDRAQTKQDEADTTVTYS